MQPVYAQSVSAWSAARDGLEIKASSLKREQAAAFYQARGFAPGAIAPYAEACGFAFELRNDGKTAVQIKLSDWSAAYGTERVHFLLPQEWDAEWAKLGVADAARIAFRWAQFPAEQEFAPGDWIMGMAALERAPAGRFRLIIRYRDEKGPHEITLEDVACASLH